MPWPLIIGMAVQAIANNVDAGLEFTNKDSPLHHDWKALIARVTDPLTVTPMSKNVPVGKYPIDKYSPYATQLGAALSGFGGGFGAGPGVGALGGLGGGGGALARIIPMLTANNQQQGGGGAPIFF